MFLFFDKPLNQAYFQDKMVTIAMQPQTYVCKFVEAEVHHILKTESRKLNKAPLLTDFSITNGVTDIIMFTDLDNPAQPLSHPYYSPLPIIIFFTQLSDVARNAEGTFDQHLAITVSIAPKLLPEDRASYRLPTSAAWRDTKMYPLDSLGRAVHPEATPWQEIMMHPASQAKNPVQLGQLKLTIPMESIYVKQSAAAKYSLFFPAQDGNISTLEEEKFPYSMNMDFGPALSNTSFEVDVQLDQQREGIRSLEQRMAAQLVASTFQPNPPPSQAQQGSNGSGQERQSSLSPHTSESSRGQQGPFSPGPDVEALPTINMTTGDPAGTSEKRMPPAASGPQDQHAGDLFTETYYNPSTLPDSVTTRRQAAPLILTKDQNEFLLLFITHLNTFKEQSISAKWLVPLVTLSTTGLFVLHEDAATAANLEVVAKLMAIEDNGQNLTTMSAQVLKNWLTKNQQRFKSSAPETPQPTID